MDMFQTDTSWNDWTLAIKQNEHMTITFYYYIKHWKLQQQQKNSKILILVNKYIEGRWLTLNKRKNIPFSFKYCHFIQFSFILAYELNRYSVITELYSDKLAAKRLLWIDWMGSTKVSFIVSNYDSIHGINWFSANNHNILVRTFHLVFNN